MFARAAGDSTSTITLRSSASAAGPPASSGRCGAGAAATSRTCAQPPLLEHVHAHRAPPSRRLPSASSAPATSSPCAQPRATHSAPAAAASAPSCGARPPPRPAAPPARARARAVAKALQRQHELGLEPYHLLPLQNEHVSELVVARERHPDRVSRWEQGRAVAAAPAAAGSPRRQVAQRGTPAPAASAPSGTRASTTACRSSSTRSRTAGSASKSSAAALQAVAATAREPSVARKRGAVSRRGQRVARRRLEGKARDRGATSPYRSTSSSRVPSGPP